MTHGTHHIFCALVLDKPTHCPVLSQRQHSQRGLRFQSAISQSLARRSISSKLEASLSLRSSTITPSPPIERITHCGQAFRRTIFFSCIHFAACLISAIILLTTGPQTGRPRQVRL